MPSEVFHNCPRQSRFIKIITAPFNWPKTKSTMAEHVFWPYPTIHRVHKPKPLNLTDMYPDAHYGGELYLARVYL